MAIMSKRWWGVVMGSFLVGTILVGTGFWLFEDQSFLENLIAEAIGLTFAFGIVVWLIEGPVLTRERKLRAILEYKWRVYQRTWEIGHMMAREIAEPIATHFEPAFDLYGDERGRWDAFEPLIRAVFRRARNVPEDGLPLYPSLDEESVRMTFESCASMENRIREVIDTKPDLENQVLPLVIALARIQQHIKMADRLGFLDDQAKRYKIIGDLGDLVLDILDTITPLPEGSRPW